MIKKKRPGRPAKEIALPIEYDFEKYNEKDLGQLSELGWFHNLWVRYSLKSTETLSLDERQKRILQILEQPIISAPRMPLCSENLAPVDWVSDDERLWHELGVSPFRVGELYKLESHLDKDSQIRGRSSYGISKRKAPDDVTQLLGLWADVSVDDAIEKQSATASITIDLDFDDEILINHFKLLLRRLRTRRESNQSKVVSIKAIDCKTMVNDWIYSSVLPCIDLMLWSQIFGKDMTYAMFSNAFFGEHDTDKIRRTILPKAKELLSRSFLMAFRANFFYRTIKNAKCPDLE